MAEERMDDLREDEKKLVQAALDEFGPERIVVGIDARDGVVRVRGWREAAPLQAADLAQRWAGMGGRWLVFTDIARDGVGSGVNVAATAELARATGLRVIASGGVTTREDLVALSGLVHLGLTGVIVGKALYSGRLNYREAQEAVLAHGKRH